MTILSRFERKNFFTDVFVVKEDSSNTYFKLLKNICKDFLLLKNSSKTGHLTRNYVSPNLLFNFTKSLHRSLLIKRNLKA